MHFCVSVILDKKEKVSYCGVYYKTIILLKNSAEFICVLQFRQIVEMWRPSLGFTFMILSYSRLQYISLAYALEATLNLSI